MYNSYLLINTSQYINYYDLINILNNSNITTDNKKYLFGTFEKKANTIKKFFKKSHNLLKNIDVIDLNNTKLWGLYYFKNYEPKFGL